MKKTRLKSRSRRSEAIASERRRVVEQVLLRHPVCQVQGCSNESQHAHEIKTRARGGSVLDTDNILAVCFHCHRKIHDNPAWATEMGLLRHSWE